MVLTRMGKNNDDGSFDWSESLIDAGIMAGLTFFTSLGGLGLTGAIGLREVLAAGVAAATQFFSILAIKRGLRQKST